MACLRHAWATWQRKAGTPTHELQRLGGWKTAMMVERYAHLAPDHLESAASRLNAVFEGYDLATFDQKEKRLASLQAA
ncbi:tyrosine-type recombinase/integrase [Methylophilus methylotrophus]|uniref:tyrosine-type recombinase/integrase n=1 Tax=Methylophilus methylotrophus TaxID=17 RepID=UPI00233F19F7|nr:tyrosine-type recombinase/integrase [Methylophilus methylotrophus]